MLFVTTPCHKRWTLKRNSMAWPPPPKQPSSRPVPTPSGRPPSRSWAGQWRNQSSTWPRSPARCASSSPANLAPPAHGQWARRETIVDVLGPCPWRASPGHVLRRPRPTAVAVQNDDQTKWVLPQRRVAMGVAAVNGVQCHWRPS